MASELRVDWCTRTAATYACECWHYSRNLPAGKLAPFGVWEGDRYVGAVVYSPGANHHAGRPFGVAQGEYAELIRVALTDHDSFVSEIVARTLKLLRAWAPGLRLVISYADPAHGHHGGIYQALGFTYLGTGSRTAHIRRPDGVLVHKRVYTGHTFDGVKNRMPIGATWEAVPAKHKYAYPLDRPMRRMLAALAMPYPIRGGSVEGDTPGVPLGEVGSIPTHRSTKESV